MTQTIQAKGILRHMFHGTYGATVALQFATLEEAARARVALGPQWQPATSALVLVARMTSDEVNAFGKLYSPKGEKCQNKRCRGKRHAFDGIDHSIDFGHPFTIDVEVTIDDVLPGQLPLFGT